MTLTTPQDTVFVLAAWALRVNAAVHWSLSDKAAGMVCMVPYGFHSTQASPFQWAVVELMWDMLRQSRPLGFGLSAVRCDALLWNSPAQAALKVFYTTFNNSTVDLPVGDWWKDVLFFILENSSLSLENLCSCRAVSNGFREYSHRALVSL